MAAQGATLQNYNNELVKCVDDLKEKREEVNKAILKDVRAGAAFLTTHGTRR
jgi:sjoegren syndrome nuclear autoantigen 1